MQIDWHALIFDSATQERMQRQALHRFKNETLAEEAITYAIDTLSRDGWQMLNAYDGRASAPTFLHVSIGHAFEDFHRRRFGRRRPPVWIQRLGSLWEQVFHQACLERLPTEEIISQIRKTAAEVGNSALTPEYARTIVSQVRGRVTDCEARSGEQAFDPSNPVLQEYASESTAPADLLAEHEFSTLLEVLAEMLGSGRASDSPSLTRQMLARRERLQSALQLADEERQLLRLIYQDGCSVSEAARHLGQADHTLRRRLRALLDRLRLLLESVGLGADDILAMLRDEAG